MKVGGAEVRSIMLQELCCGTELSAPAPALIGEPNFRKHACHGSPTAPGGAACRWSMLNLNG